VAEGIIDPKAKVICILTGHLLKDPELVVRYHKGELAEGLYAADRRNPPIKAPADAAGLLAMVTEALGR
jgi:threonine synthase